MATELINIRVYSETGGIDGSLSPVISIYDNDTSTQVVTNDPVTWNGPMGRYQYLFSSFIETHSYICDVFFGSNALTKYTTFGIGGGVAGGLTSEQATQLASTVKSGAKIICVDSDIAIIK